MAEFIYKDLSYSVVGAALEVHRFLGPGFLESVYRRALAHELTVGKIQFLREAPINVNYKDIEVGKYKTDFVIDNKIILEVKASSTLVPRHEAQALHYLAATGLRPALLLNFGTESLQIKRIIR